MSVSLNICLSVCMTGCLSVCLTICLSIYLLHQWVFKCFKLKACNISSFVFCYIWHNSIKSLLLFPSDCHPPFLPCVLFHSLNQCFFHLISSPFPPCLPSFLHSSLSFYHFLFNRGMHPIRHIVLLFPDCVVLIELLFPFDCCLFLSNPPIIIITIIPLISSQRQRSKRWMMDWLTDCVSLWRTLSKSAAPPPYDDNGHRGPQRSSNPDIVQGYQMDDYPKNFSPYSTAGEHQNKPVSVWMIQRRPARVKHDA